MKLTDTQLILLGEASNRLDRAIVLPDRLKGGAATKVIDRLLRAKLVEEVAAAGTLPVWRRDDERGPIALIITGAGLKAINSEDGGPSACAGLLGRATSIDQHVKSVCFKSFILWANQD
jgi:hypothetical protein